jgi:DNA-binding CsgD family transcriptional regulator
MRSVDYRRALEFVAEVGAVSTLDEFAQVSLVALHRLVPSDVVSLNELNPARGRACIYADPPESLFDGAVEALELHLKENPIVAHYQRHPESVVTRLSEFLSVRQLYQTGLWADVYRPIGMERQVVTPLPAHPPRVVGLASFRTGQDFTSREVALLSLVQGPLAQVYQRLEERELLEALLQTPEEAGFGALVLSPLGEVLQETAAARELLGVPARYGSEGSDLPSDLLRCVEGGSTEVPRSFAYRGALVTVTPVPRGRRHVVVLRPAVGAIADRVDGYALTRREIEVLGHLARGRTNVEIAAAIGARPLTVKKHLERIYAKLGVPNRAAAIARVSQVG